MRLRVYIGILVSLCFCLPAQAQGFWSRLTTKISGLETKISSKVMQSIALQPITSPAILPLLRRSAPLPRLTPPIYRPPQHILQNVFTLASSPTNKNKGTAFALEVDGKMWGVTARHIFNDIGRSAYMTMANPLNPAETLHAPISPVREGSVNGADVAIFEIPPEIAPFIKPLQPDYELPLAGTTLTSAGFGHGFFTWQADRPVLFASQHRILTQYTNFPNRSGYCGAAVMLNGKVVGVHVGSILQSQDKLPEWEYLTLRKADEQMKEVSQVVPIQWVRRLAQETQKLEPEKEDFFINGQKIGSLATDESIAEIMHLREGRIVKRLPAYPFLDYKYLERFLEIEPFDTVIIRVTKGDNHSLRRISRWYEWDAHTNIVLQRSSLY